MDATHSVYAARDKMLSHAAEELALVEASRNAEARPARIAEVHEHIAEISRIADLVTTWEPLPEPVPVPVGVVEGWQGTLTLPFERTTGELELDRRVSAPRVDADKPVKQSTEVAADRLFALITHQDTPPSSNPRFVGARPHREIYVELFGDKNIGRLAPKTVAAKIPAYVDGARDVHQGIRDVVESDIGDDWARLTRPQVDATMERALAQYPGILADPPQPNRYDPNRLDPLIFPGHLPKGRLRNALDTYYRAEIPAAWRRARRREVDALIDRQAAMTRREYRTACALIPAKLAPLALVPQWGGPDAPAEADALVKALIGSRSWSIGELDVRLDPGGPIRRSGRWGFALG